MKKRVAKIKYRESRQWRDCYGKSVAEFDETGVANLDIFPYMPIRDKKVVESFKELRVKILLAIYNATSLREPQEVKIENAVFKIYPNVDENIVKKFKVSEW